jgi:hypothetical protein
MKKLLLTIFTSLFLIQQAFATTSYYVASTGSDSNAGTLASPFLTMAPVTGTNFLPSGSTVNVEAPYTLTGTACNFTINSSGLPGNPITIQGIGGQPVFDCAVNITSLSGWTGWTNTSGNIYESNITIPFIVESVIIDGTTGMIYSSANYTTTNNRYAQISNHLYVNLADGSSPAGHTVEVVGEYQTNPNGGNIATNGNYIIFNNLKSYGATGAGFLAVNKGVVVENSTSIFSGYAGIYCATHSQAVGCYNSNFYGNLIAYASGGNTDIQGVGEAYISEGSNNDFYNNTVEYGAMAGVDVNDYTTDTPAQYNRVHDNLIEFNSQRSLQNTDNGFDPQLYCDGCSYFQAYNNTVIGNSSNASYTSQNGSTGISISSEHPTTAIPHDIYVYNNVVYQNSFQAVGAGGNGQNSAYNMWFIGNTFYNPSNPGFLATFKNFNTSFGQTLHIYSNIFMQNQNANSFMSTDSTGTSVWDGNNNDYFSTNGAHIIFNGTTTLAAWQTATGGDANSINTNPAFVANNSDFHLKRTALGQSTNSPAIGVGSPNYWAPYFNIYNIGSTRTDALPDNPSAPDMGYHYGLIVGSSLNWNKGQAGSSITGSFS